MSQRHAQIFKSLRPHVLKRLVDVRGSMDNGFARIAPETIRGEFDVILDKMESYLATGDTSQYRSFASRYFAMRVGEGFTHENLIHSVIAIGDVIVQVARRRLEPTSECYDFIREVVKMNLDNARMMVTILAEDLGQREAQREAARGHTP